jgi:hypothetical protein
MTRHILISSIALFAMAWTACAQPRIDDGLLTSARRALPRDVSTNEMIRALESGLWNSNRTAVAISIPKPKASVLFVFLRQARGDYLAVDAVRSRATADIIRVRPAWR